MKIDSRLDTYELSAARTNRYGAYVCGAKSLLLASQSALVARGEKPDERMAVAWHAGWAALLKLEPKGLDVRVLQELGFLFSDILGEKSIEDLLVYSRDGLAPLTGEYKQHGSFQL
ncbi:MAG: hypothetical protein KGI79_01120 [Patescibacteria group bacterium]|nr:hypothetical protein [Patescibacteria group bacterium]MDE2116458.1 hypothetical protein [Patescibacteria group bacterium]